MCEDIKIWCRKADRCIIGEGKGIMAVYKGGLEIEGERVLEDKTAWIHEFAGCEVRINKDASGHIGTPLSKNWKSLKKEGTQEKHRYPRSNSFTSEKSKRGVMIGTIARLPTQCHPRENVVQSLLQEAVEWRSIGYTWRTFGNALMKRRVRLEEKKEEDLRKNLENAYLVLRIMEKSIQRKEEGEGEEETGIRAEVKKGVRWIEKWKKRERKEKREPK